MQRLKFSSVLAPKLIKPHRTPAELIEAAEMNEIYKKTKLRYTRAWDASEALRIKKKFLAIEELPVQLREAARQTDKSRPPDEFIWPRIDPPREGEEIFGKGQLLGQVLAVPESGVMAFPQFKK